jgi:hypothetical protein
MIVNENVGKSSESYLCENCNYKTDKKFNYEKHLLTLKHLKSIKCNSNVAKSSFSKFVCKICSKNYKDSSGLWRHNKKCSGIEIENGIGKVNKLTKPDDKEKQLEVITELFQEQMKENKELKELLIEQNKKLLEIAEKNHGQITNITNNTTNNTTNNNFNLQFFLNEQCKDALNIMDFINQLQMKLTDLDMVGRVGYTEGISKIFIRGLKELDVFKRPIHCSDLKREILYVKDKDSWEKDSEEKNKMKTAIKYIAAKNFKQIQDWKDENPESEDIDTKKHMDYQYILMNSMGGSTYEEDEKYYNKIIRNVAKEVTIDKSENKNII